MLGRKLPHRGTLKPSNASGERRFRGNRQDAPNHPSLTGLAFQVNAERMHSDGNSRMRHLRMAVKIPEFILTAGPRPESKDSRHEARRMAMGSFCGRGLVWT